MIVILTSSGLSQIRLMGRTSFRGILLGNDLRRKALTVAVVAFMTDRYPCRCGNVYTKFSQPHPSELDSVKNDEQDSIVKAGCLKPDIDE